MHVWRVVYTALSPHSNSKILILGAHIISCWENVFLITIGAIKSTIYMMPNSIFIDVLKITHTCKNLSPIPWMSKVIMWNIFGCAGYLTMYKVKLLPSVKCGVCSEVILATRGKWNHNESILSHFWKGKNKNCAALRWNILRLQEELTSLPKLY
jgi:hypothetical protein